MFGLGTTELVIILVVVLVLFGPKRLPQMGKALGETIKQLRSSAKGDDEPASDTETKEPVASKKSENTDS